MKKISVLIVLLAGYMISFGQSLNDINELMGKSDYKKAKEGIDKFLADPKNANSIEGWYYKGRVYNSLSKETGTAPATALQLKKEAFEAFKKNQQLDTKDIRLKIEVPSYASYVDLYNGLFDVGSVSYSAKDFSGAANAFKTALAVGDYSRMKGYEFNGFKFPVLDTSLILNTGLALRNAGNDAEAMVYYKKLADANLKAAAYQDVYSTLITYYNTTNDATNLQAITDKAKAFYPNVDWNGRAIDVDMERIDNIKDKQEQLAQLEIASKKYPASAYVSRYYASKLYTAIYFADGKPDNLEAMKTSMVNNIKNVLANGAKDEKNDANILMSHYLYNTALEYSDSVSKYGKSAKPADIKKKGEFKTMYDQKVAEDIPYTEEVVKYFSELPTLKATQKANYKSMLERIAELYNSKGDKAKAAEYTKKKEEVDKM